MSEDGGDRFVGRTLLALLCAVPLLPGLGLFTNYDDPKWLLLHAGVALALLLALARAVSRRRKVRVVFPESLAALALLVVVGLWILPKGADRHAGLRAWAAVGSLTAFGVLVTRYLADDRGCRRALTAVVAAGGAATLAAAALLVAGEPHPGSSTFGNPMFAGEFAAPALLVAVGLWGAGRRGVAAAGGLLLILLLVIAKSRAGWLGGLAGLLALAVLILFRRRAFLPRPAFLAAGAILGVAALPFLVDLLPVPHLGRSDTVRVRHLTRIAAFEIAADHPLTGVGLDGFGAAYPPYRDPAEYELSRGRDVSFPHNLFAGIAAETGFPGLIAFLAFLFVVLRSGFAAWTREPAHPLARGLPAAMIALLAAAQFSAPLRHPASALLFFLLAGLMMVRRPRRYVTDLKGRHHRGLFVLALLVGPLVGLFQLPPHLLADARLKGALDHVGDRDGAMDEEFARRLQSSVDARPLPEALRLLAVYRTLSGDPEGALALLDRLRELRPHDDRAEIERARALLAKGRPDQALDLLERLRARRPGDDVLLVLRTLALYPRDPRTAVEDLLAALRTEPLADVREISRQASGALPALSMALFRTAERIGQAEGGTERALSILAGFDSPEAAYYRALVLLSAGRLDDAMAWLRGVAREGAADRARLRDDPRLEPLRGRADFQELSKE